VQARDEHLLLLAVTAGDWLSYERFSRDAMIICAMLRILGGVRRRGDDKLKGGGKAANYRAFPPPHVLLLLLR